MNTPQLISIIVISSLVWTLLGIVPLGLLWNDCHKTKQRALLLFIAGPLLWAYCVIVYIFEKMGDEP